MVSTTYDRHWSKRPTLTNELSLLSLNRYHFAVIDNMVRNAGQLPQPFWLGAAYGGGSCGAAPCAART